MEWYYAKGDESIGPLNEEQLKSLIISEEITPDTMVWNEGMEDWVLAMDSPIAPLFEGAKQEVATLPKGFKPTVWLTFILKGMLAIYFAFVIANLISISMQHVMLLDLQEGIQFTDEELDANDTRVNAIDSMNLAFFILTGIVWMVWKHTNAKNIRIMYGSKRNYQYGPKMAAWSYIIPIISLYYPYVAMKEIWKGYSTEEDWEVKQPPAFFGLWWFAWLVVSISGRLSSRSMEDATEVDAIISANTWFLANTVGELVLTILAFLVIRSVYKRSLASAANFTDA